MQIILFYVSFVLDLILKMLIEINLQEVLGELPCILSSLYFRFDKNNNLFHIEYQITLSRVDILDRSVHFFTTV